MATQSTCPLDSVLPPSVLVGGNAVWSRYRQYPVFSLPWLRGRSLLFAIAIGSFALLTVFGAGLSTRNYGVALLSGGHMFVAFMLMAAAGPALATWVRYRRWPPSRERKVVVLAVLAGMAISYFVDSWASGYIEREMLGAYEVAGRPLPKAEPAPGLEKNLMRVLNVVLPAVIYGLFGGGLALRAYFSEQRRWLDDRHKAELARLQQLKHDSDLRLGALQAQVEPHFLFNTLASVRALVRQDPAQAELTLDALVAYLRRTIPRLRNGDDGDGALHSTLGEQLDICASYLEVMRLRMGGRLGYSIDVDDVLRGQPYPPLLLITLVENAIKHGIEPKRGEGRVMIQAGVEGEQLRVGIHDDGVGLRPGFGSGVGLDNIREQLRTRYGNRARLELRGAPDGGVVAEIRLPMEERT